MRKAEDVAPVWGWRPKSCGRDSGPSPSMQRPPAWSVMSRAASGGTRPALEGRARGSVSSVWLSCPSRLMGWHPPYWGPSFLCCSGILHQSSLEIPSQTCLQIVLSQCSTHSLFRPVDAKINHDTNIAYRWLGQLRRLWQNTPDKVAYTSRKWKSKIQVLEDPALGKGYSWLVDDSTSYHHMVERGRELCCLFLSL